jgi:superoxide dismutase, Fe-Mn family
MKDSMTRRQAIQAGTLSVAMGSLGGLISIEKALAAEPKSKISGAFATNHQPKPLPFKPSKLKGLSEKLMTSHWENNYSGAVKALNQVEGKLAALAKDKDTSPNLFTAAKREQELRLGSVILHEKYFGNLGGDGKMSGDIKEAIAAGFGSTDAWEAEFRKTALGLGGGSGWVVLAYNLHLMRLETYWSWDHLHNLPSSFPVMVLDMYEHAYQMDYGAQAAKYIDAFMANVNWEEANRRYFAIRKVASTISA